MIMDWRNVKDVSIGGKAASKVYLDNRLIWQKPSIISIDHLLIYAPEPLHLGLNEIHVGVGPEGSLDDLEMSLDWNGILIDTEKGIWIDHIGGTPFPEYYYMLECYVDVTEMKEIWSNIQFLQVTAKSKSTGYSVVSDKIVPVQPEPKYAVLYSENPTVIDWLRTKYTFEDYTVGITMDEARTITELPAATSALKSGLRAFDELQYFTGITTLGKRDDSSASTTSPFVGCSNLTSITLPDSCIALGRSCFDNCSKLSSVKNCKVKELYRSCFANCGALDLSTVDLSNVELIYGAYCLCYNTTSTTGIIDLSNLKQYNNVSSTATNAVGISNIGNVCSIRLPDYNQVNFITSKKFIYTNAKLTLYIKSGQKSLWNAKVSSGASYITYVEE